jgi:hypothetical protein
LFILTFIDVASKETRFDGTLFRFPLRTGEQAENSEISNSPYLISSVEALFDSFKRDAGIILLFLKFVESIEICRRDKEGTLSLLYSTHIQLPDNLELFRKNRSKLVEYVTSTNESGSYLDSLPSCYNTTLFDVTIVTTGEESTTWTVHLIWLNSY